MEVRNEGVGIRVREVGADGRVGADDLAGSVKCNKCGDTRDPLPCKRTNYDYKPRQGAVIYRLLHAWPTMHARHTHHARMPGPPCMHDTLTMHA